MNETEAGSNKNATDLAEIGYETKTELIEQSEDNNLGLSNISEESPDTNKDNEKPVVPFKKPVLIGKIGRLPRKMNSKNTIANQKIEQSESEINISEKKDDSLIKPDVEAKVKLVPEKPIKAPAQQLAESSTPLPYKEPNWSGLPRGNKEYAFEVLKSGVIVEQINLMAKPFWVFGRSTNCEICMAHPTISRYHAVLQYRKEGTPEEPSGFYIYDLNSTHGTFLNKGRLKSRVYAPVKVGHMIKLGFSTRSYVLTGPEEDEEEESEFTLTELKQQRAEKLIQQKLAEKEAQLNTEKEIEEKRKRDEERGVDWGLGEDAEEESDITENPFAQTNNEELYLDDPKKALRGFMEREGYNLEYDCTEQGFGQFLCKVELPLDDECGRPIVAEILHKGKKKEAVVQCALEACRILDRHGVLRQATHESRKRKAKNWEENDYYDSDDDTFLDRTGVIEKKREKRMKAKIPQQPETYQSLLEKEKKISRQISEIEKQLSKARSVASHQSSNVEEDSLDSFMKELKDSKPDKQTISKLKTELAGLKVEHVSIVKLVNLVKPADLPPLVIDSTGLNDQPGNSGIAKSKALPLFGKRPKLKVQLLEKPAVEETKTHVDVDDEEEEEEDEKEPAVGEPSSSVKQTEPNSNTSSTSIENESEQIKHQMDTVPCHIRVYRKLSEFEKLISEYKFPPVLEQNVAEIRDVLQKMKELTEHEDRLQCDKKILMAKNRKVKKHIDNLLESYDEHDSVRICKELRRIYSEIQDMVEKQHMISAKVRILGMKIDLICKEVLKEFNKLKDEDKISDVVDDELNSKSNVQEVQDRLESTKEDEKDDGEQLTPEELEKRKKKNQRRILQRKERMEIEKQKGYQEDARKEDYNMWIPPSNQSGDGRTSLNEKYGY